jgi:hypothetical protein
MIITREYLAAIPQFSADQADRSIEMAIRKIANR